MACLFFSPLITAALSIQVYVFSLLSYFIDVICTHIHTPARTHVRAYSLNEALVFVGKAIIVAHLLLPLLTHSVIAALHNVFIVETRKAIMIKFRLIVHPHADICSHSCCRSALHLYSHTKADFIIYVPYTQTRTVFHIRCPHITL